MKEQKVTVTASTNLSKDEIERKVQEARQNEAEDKKRKEAIEVKNQADNLIYQTEKALRDLGEKVPAAERGNIESKVAELKQVLPGEDLEQTKKLTEEVQQAFYALSQQLYAQDGQQQSPSEGGPAAPPPPEGDDVIDGEVKE